MSPLLEIGALVAGVPLVLLALTLLLARVEARMIAEHERNDTSREEAAPQQALEELAQGVTHLPQQPASTVEHTPEARSA